jgi:HK97 family phage prohead protease
MTATDNAVEPRTRLTLVRSFELPLADSWDGRTLDVRIVPYNRSAVVSDPPDFRPYQEMFMPGAFERQLTTAGRDKVLLNFEHEQGIRGVVGHSLRFADSGDELIASFGVHENSDGDKALLMVREGLLTGLSLEFAALSSRRVGGVVQRLRAQLDKVSLCRYPAYPDAQVLAVRQEPDQAADTAAVVVADLARSSDVDELLATLAFEPLSRTAKTERAWDGSPGRFTDEQYQAAALLCRPGDKPLKERCSLPVLEPDGTLNVNALAAAAGALAGGRGGLTNVTLAMKAAAARKLVRYYNQAAVDPPAALRQLAGSA